MSILLRRVLENTTFLVIGQVFGIFLTFIASILLIRNLGSTGYGEYVFIYAFLSLFDWIVTFGMDNILVREAANLTHNRDSIWTSGFVIQVCLSFIAVMLMVGIALISGHSEETILFLLIGAIEVLLLLPWRLVSRILQVELQQWRAIVATLTRQTVWLGILVILANQSASLILLIFLRTVTALVEILIMLYLSRSFLHIRFSLDYKLAGKILLNSWPLALTSLSIAVYHRIDRIFIEYFLDAQPLGIYSAADNLAIMMGIVPLAFMSSVFPVMSKQIENKNNYFQITNIAYRWILSWSVFFAGLLVLLGPILVVFVYGDEFIISGDLLRILAWSQVAVAFGIVISQILISQNLQIYITLSTIIGAMINVIGNLLIIPLYGIIGAALVTLFSYIFASVLCFMIFPVTRKHASPGCVILLKIIAIICLPLFIQYYLQLSSFIGLGVYLIVSLMGMYIFNLITKDDLQLILTILKGFASKRKIPI